MLPQSWDRDRLLCSFLGPFRDQDEETHRKREVQPQGRHTLGCLDTKYEIRRMERKRTLKTQARNKTLSKRSCRFFKNKMEQTEMKINIAIKNSVVRLYSLLDTM